MPISRLAFLKKRFNGDGQILVARIVFRLGDEAAQLRGALHTFGIPKDKVAGRFGLASTDQFQLLSAAVRGRQVIPRAH